MEKGEEFGSLGEGFSSRRKEEDGGYGVLGVLGSRKGGRR